MASEPVPTCQNGLLVGLTARRSPWQTGFRLREPDPPEASRACLPLRRRPVQLHFALPGQPSAIAAGFGIGTATAYRYIREAIEVLAVLAPTLQQAMDEARRKAFLILDGTLLPIDRIAEDRPYYSGKHKRHGMNVQVIARSRPSRLVKPFP